MTLDEIILQEASGQSDADKLALSQLFGGSVDTVLFSDLIGLLYGVTFVIGTIMLIVYFTINLQEAVVKKQFTAEYLIKMLIKFLVGYLFFANIKDIILGMNIFIDTVISEFGLSTVTMPRASETWGIQTEVESISFFTHSNTELLRSGPIALLAGLLNIAVWWIIFVAAIRRAILIGIYYVLSPIVFADAFSNGISGIASRLKGVLATFLQYPFIVLVVKLGMILIDNVTNAHALRMASVYAIFLLFLGIIRTISGSKDELETMFGS